MRGFLFYGNYMKYEGFNILAKSYNVVPVYEKITADLLTPVTAYLKIRNSGSPNFLLESVEGNETLARYSFIGTNPDTVIMNKGLDLTIIMNGRAETRKQSVFEFLKANFKNYKQPEIEDLPDFKGGLVGYFGYENIALIENIISFDYPKSSNPDSIFGIYNTILAFDHYKHQIILIRNVKIDKETNLVNAYNSAIDEIKLLKKKLYKPLQYNSDFKLLNREETAPDPAEFYKLVNLAKQNIIEGDIFQVVLSKRFSSEFTGDPFNVYRALRIINPSPYMYFLEFDHDFKIIGTSPEDLIKVKNGKAQVLPIAGTRKRGNTAEKQKRLEEDLLNDPKEIAEHTMLLDLGRNDLGRVCKYGSIRVTEKMKLQKYSHVIHLVSKVEGEIAEDKDSIDALMSCFPAGTVTGAPKIRAIQLINDYEGNERNVYAGSVGYFDFSGNLDMCIAIRTLFTNGKTIFWQSGAGIVADSKPELELKEIKNKSAALVSALKYAEVIDENISD